MSRWAFPCVVGIVLASLLAACGGGEPGIQQSAEVEPGQEWVGSLELHDGYFGTDPEWWVSFADAVATFRVVEVDEGRRQENVTGRVAVERLLTLRIDEVLWIQTGGRGQVVPNEITVQGDGAMYRDGELEQEEPAQRVSDQLWVGPLGYIPDQDEWFVFGESVARVDGSGIVQTSRHAMTGHAIGDVSDLLDTTEPLDVDFSIVDPVARALAYEDRLAAEAERLEPAPTPDPDFVKPCPVDADPIPDEVMEECRRRLEEAESD